MAEQTAQQQVQPQMFYQQPAATPVYQGRADQVAPPAAPTASVLGLNVQDSQFWKGALLGAAVTLLVTNETVQKGLVKTISKLTLAAQCGIEEIKEKFEDAKAEAHAETETKQKAAADE